jgi:hypothetical protein
MSIRKLITDLNGNSVWATEKQCNAIDVLKETNAGGIAGINGYIPTTNYTTPPVQNMQIITRFNYEKLLQRRLNAYAGISFDDVKPYITGKLVSLPETGQRTLFFQRLQQEIDSATKTIDGDRSDSHRQGHDRCYVRFTEGISAHLVTEKGSDGLMHPVLSDGYPTVDSIMVSFLELNRTIVKQGVRKIINSGPSVLMKNAIDKVLNQRSVGIRKISLKENNFDSLNISKNSIVPDNI